MSVSDTVQHSTSTHNRWLTDFIDVLKGGLKVVLVSTHFSQLHVDSTPQTMLKTESRTLIYHVGIDACAQLVSLTCLLAPVQRLVL